MLWIIGPAYSIRQESNNSQQNNPPNLSPYCEPANNADQIRYRNLLRLVGAYNIRQETNNSQQNPS